MASNVSSYHLSFTPGKPSFVPNLSNCFPYTNLLIEERFGECLGPHLAVQVNIFLVIAELYRVKDEMLFIADVWVLKKY